MDPAIDQSRHAALWDLANCQHGVVARAQLMELGYSEYAIRHRIAVGRLHRVRRGVYAIGRPALSRHGHWLAAVLACGPDAVLSHGSAAALWGILPVRAGRIEVSVRSELARRPAGILVHRRRVLAREAVTVWDGIPVTDPVCTLIDIAGRFGPERLEAAINEADKLDLASPEELRSALDGISPRRGVRALREVLDRRTFTLTDSELERRFLRLVGDAGLPTPHTGRRVNGFRVDFYWPELRLVVETDGLRYHRTPAQQTRDRLRDQVHAATGLTALRFTHAQVRFDAAHVRATLAAVGGRP